MNEMPKEFHNAWRESDGIAFDSVGCNHEQQATPPLWTGGGCMNPAETIDYLAAIGIVERGAMKLAGENKVLRDLLGEAESVIKTIHGETSDEHDRLAALARQIEAARFGHA